MNIPWQVYRVAFRSQREDAWIVARIEGDTIHFYTPPSDWPWFFVTAEGAERHANQANAAIDDEETAA